MNRTAVNPWNWSIGLGYNQGEVVTGNTRTLYCAGQTATGSEGQPLHPGDMALQLTVALDNLEAVLRKADMTLSNLVRLTIYATDVDQLLPNYGALAGRLAAARVAPPTTLVGVTRLALPGLMVEIEGTAVA